jgi:exodeoxyribonuclease-3
MTEIDIVMSMKIASWNINSIKARLPVVTQWLDKESPDILFMQELKGVIENFPRDEFESRGYTLEIHGQKTYNGVAIASKMPITLISNEILKDDDQARYLEVDINGIRMINIYAPNGNPVDIDSEKYPYKLKWTQTLIERAKDLFAEGIPFFIAGDFNIIPEDKDCHNPVAWEGDALFRPESRALWRTLKNIGLYDAYRMIHPYEADCYTFWDYQAGAWPQNKGIRIDHFLLSPEIADQLQNCWIDREPREWDKASDHTPILIEI